MKDAGWIAINLPWYKYEEVERIDTKKDVREKLEEELTSLVEKEVGYTTADNKDELELLSSENGFRYGWEAIDDIEEKFPILDGIYDEDTPTPYEVRFNEEWKNKALKEVGDNKLAINIVRRRYLKGKIDEALSNSEELAELYDILKKENDKTDVEVVCFRDHPLCRPGVLVEVQTPNGIKRWLIGDMNTLGGVCDDCTDIKKDDTVLRAKIVYDKEVIGNE